MKKQPFSSLVYADCVHVSCPCGFSIGGEGEDISKFIKLHKKHTNGKITETLTSDGARFIRFDNGSTQQTRKL